MFLHNGKEYTLYTEKPIMIILLWLIKNNRINEVRNILELNENYFYPEKHDMFNFNRFMNHATDIKEETCYTNEAIRSNNREMLKLLLDYGLPVEIINEKKKNTPENNYALLTQYKNIDPDKPFITEDEDLFEIILRSVTDINKIYYISWTEDGNKTERREMSLLSMALYFNKMNLADILIKKGARLEFNLYKNIIDYTQGFINTGWEYFNSAITTGYKFKEMPLDNNPDLLHEWSPVRIVLGKGNIKQIEWLVAHAVNNPKLMREIALSLSYLKNTDFRSFIKKFPIFKKFLNWKNICYFSNEDALQIYLKERQPDIGSREIMELLDFNFQTSRSLNEVIDLVLSDKFYKCVRILYSYAPEAFSNEEVQNQLYNLAIYTWFMVYALNDGDPEKCKNLKLLGFYDEIATAVPDASLFVRWLYLNGRRNDLYNLSAKEAAGVFKICQRPGRDEKPKINLTTTFHEVNDITMTELAAIMETFHMTSGEETLCDFYKEVIKKDNVPLLKKLLSASDFTDNELQQLTEYAIDEGAEKLIPILLLYKMKKFGSN